MRLLAAIRAETYASGPAAKVYLDLEAFKRASLAVEYERYAYRPYQQLWSDYVPALRIVDPLMNTGPEARSYFASTAPSEMAA